jgi:hypothetical protein
MGICESKILSKWNQKVHGGEDEVELTGNVHVVIVGIDYSCDTQSWAGKSPLDTRFAFDLMIHLATESEVTTLATLWNQQATLENVKEMIKSVGRNAEDDDFFVFYYTGHGAELPSVCEHDDEEQDQCFCLVDQFGNTDDAAMQLRSQIWLRDNDFAECILESVGESVKVVVLADCCHSGSICDFSPTSEWAIRGQPAISISGCQDSQTSAGTGRGGMFTRSLAKAIVAERVDEDSDNHLNFADVYNRTLDIYVADNNTGHEQNITIHGCKLYPCDMPFPFQPPGDWAPKL